MWLFDKIKKMFDKTISLSEKNRSNLITYIKLKNNTLKLGQEIKIDDGYNLVSIYYNHFCDIVGSGTHKMDELVLPRMYRLFYNATRKENENISDKIQNADLYFLNLSQMKALLRTGKIVFMSNGEKVKARLKYDVEYKISDVTKFMEYFASEFAILKNSKVVGEVEYFLNDKIENCVENSDFDDLFSKKSDVEAMMLNKLQEMKDELGVEVVSVVLSDIEVPKKQLGKKIIAKNKVETSDEVLKMVENSINGVTSAKEEVLARDATQEMAKKEDESSFSAQNGLSSNGGFNLQNAEQCSAQKASPSCDDIIKDVNLTQGALYNVDGKKEKWEDSYKIETSPYKISDAPQEAPNLFEEPRVESKKLVNESEEPPKVITKYKVVVKCPCCGAKNDEDAETCMVCKSKL